MVALRAAATGERARLVHTLAFHGSDEEFVRRAGRFCRDGLEHHEPTIARLDERRLDQLRTALGDPPEMLFLPSEQQFAHPPGAFKAIFELLETHGRDPSKHVRLLGELPAVSDLGADAWLRYEAAVNQVLGDRPVHALCLYNTRAVPAAMREEALRTHPLVLDGDGSARANAHYEPPERFLSNRRHELRDPLEGHPCDLHLVDPDPAASRAAVAELADAVELAPTATDNLLVAVNEVVTNAILHGNRPVELRAWGRPSRVVVAVSDAGRGPRDPLTGLLPVRPGAREGGLGLWITHQLCPETALEHSGGFTVRLAAGALAGARR